MNQILGVIGEKTIIKRDTTCKPYVAAHNYNADREDWDYGDYFDTFQDACIFAISKLGNDTPTSLAVADIHHNYERVCTAEYIFENNEVSKEDAYEWAARVRELMDEDEDYNKFEGEYIAALKGDYVKEAE